jgi:hypothetical protein
LRPFCPTKKKKNFEHFRSASHTKATPRARILRSHYLDKGMSQAHQPLVGIEDHLKRFEEVRNFFFFFEASGNIV